VDLKAVGQGMLLALRLPMTDDIELV
jgi:hypothetical protein